MAGMLPSFIINILSGNDYLISIDYHYNNQTLPFIFAAAAAGLGRFTGKSESSSKLVTSCALAMLLATVIANERWSHAPLQECFSRLHNQSTYADQSTGNVRLQHLLDLLDQSPTLAIAASHNLVPALANRNQIYMFPTPFKASYWGIRGENLPSPDILQALILDSNVLDADAMNLCSGLVASNRFSFVKRDGNFVLLQRKHPPAIKQIVTTDTTPPADKVRVSVYHPGGAVTSLYELFPGETPMLTNETLQVRIPLTSGPLLTAEGESLGGADNLRIVFEGQWMFSGTAPVTFKAQCDDGCRLYVDAKLVLDQAGVHSFNEIRESAPLQFGPGSHRIRVDYFEWGGEAGLSVNWAGPDKSYRQLKGGDLLP